MMKNEQKTISRLNLQIEWRCLGNLRRINRRNGFHFLAQICLRLQRKSELFNSTSQQIPRAIETRCCKHSISRTLRKQKQKLCLTNLKSKLYLISLNIVKKKFLRYFLSFHNKIAWGFLIYDLINAIDIHSIYKYH